MKRMNLSIKSFSLLFLVSFSLITTLVLNSCKKDIERINPDFTRDSIMDVDSNYYHIVKIGQDWWMMENLKTTKYRDGSAIYLAQGDQDWLKDSAGYCIYKHDKKSPGLLYNWMAVNDERKLAPEGWHVATEEDWKHLEITLGMEFSDLQKSGWRGNDEGGKLKKEDRKAWLVEPETWATNSSGFSALAGGARLFNAKWADPGLFKAGFWWTGTKANSTKAFYRHLDYKTNKIFRDSVSFISGYSVRCVKDK